MYVIQIHGREAVAELIYAMDTIVKYADRSTVLDIRVGIDPLDNGVKFSVNGLVWSPRIKGDITIPQAGRKYLND